MTVTGIINHEGRQVIPCLVLEEGNVAITLARGMAFNLAIRARSVAGKVHRYGINKDVDATVNTLIKSVSFYACDYEDWLKEMEEGKTPHTVRVNL